MPEHLNKLATYFNTSVDYLLNGTVVDAEMPGAKTNSVRETHAAYDAHPPPPACPQCVEYRREVVWLRQTITTMQNNFAAALAAAEKKGKT